MLTLALRSVRENPARYLLTAIAVALGVAFFVATTVLTATVDRSLSGAVDDFFDGVDAGVRSTDFIETQFIDIRRPLDPAVIEEVEQVPGVAAVAPQLTGYAELVGADGKTIGDFGTAVVIWSDSEQLNGYQIVEGRAPAAPNEVIVDTNSLEDGGLAIGDEVRILPKSADEPYVIVGSMEAPDGGGLAGQVGVGLTFEGAAELFGNDQVTSLWVAAEDGVSEDELLDNLNAALPADVEAVSGQTLADEIKDVLNQFTDIIGTFLTVFAVIALFVGTFVIYNTFTITVSQRLREMAMLRAIGAVRRQVLGNVLVESLTIGLVASLVGVAGGVGLGWVLLRLLDSLGLPLGSPTIVPASLVIGLIIGLAVTLASAYIPARRGASVPPIAALRDTAVESGSVSRWRALSGVALVVVGAVLSLLGATGGGSVAGFAGAGALFLGVIVGAPAAVPYMVHWLAWPLRRWRGTVGELAGENAARSPKRTATTALALLIGITLITAAAVVTESFKASIRGELDELIVADLVVESGRFNGGLTSEQTALVASAPGVEGVSPLRDGSVEFQGSVDTVTGVNPAAVDLVLNFDVVEGDLADLGGETVAVEEGTARDNGLTIGDTVTLDFQTGARELQIVALYEENVLGGNFVSDAEVVSQGDLTALDSFVLVAANDPVLAQAEIAALLADNPTADVEPTNEWIDSQADQLNTLLALLYGLLALSIIIALIGVANTMSLSIFERTREMGLLRAVGMTGRQLRAAVRYESSLVAMMGTVIGLVIGVFFGWLAQRALVDTFPNFAVPYFQLVVILVVGLLAGVVAGWRPSRRASRLDVLDAIAHE